MATKPTNDIVNHFFFWNKLILTLKVDISNQSEPKKQYKIQIWKKKLHNAPNIIMKLQQRLRPWSKNLKTRQNLKEVCLSNLSVFEKKLRSKNHVLVHFTPWKQHTSPFLCFFKKNDFESKNLLRVRFWVDKYEMHQILI